MTDSNQSLIVTTSHKARPEAIAYAVSRADEWGLDFVGRNASPIEDVLGDAVAALVFSNGDLHLASRHGRLKHHLGTAYIRLKSLERGDGDPLVRAGSLASGDSVLDTTFGLGRDAAVAARAVGRDGTVVGLESSPALFHLAKEATASSKTDDQSADVQLLHVDAREYLHDAATASVDVVLIDPMFTEPKAADAGFELLRAVADPTPLDRSWVDEARRVARRWVVVKSGDEMPWFSAEALERVHSHSNATWYRTPPLAVR